MPSVLADDRVCTQHENDRYRWGRCFGGHRCCCAIDRHDHGHPTMLNQISRQGGKSIILAFRPAIFDTDVLALDVTDLCQSLMKSCYQVAPRFQRPGI
jgi:hypothetical protein